MEDAKDLDFIRTLPLAGRHIGVHAGNEDGDYFIGLSTENARKFAESIIACADLSDEAADEEQDA